MHKPLFSQIQTWVFDLDHTLYPPEQRLFDQIEVKMLDYVQRVTGISRPEADDLRRRYWATYGTTLAGLMKHHNVEPDGFLEEVHDISFDPLKVDLALAAHIQALPGRKIVYTNGTAPYATQVIKARGLEGCFEAIYGVEHADYIPKPQTEAFETVFAKASLDPTRAAMFEDDPRNLAAPHAMGLRTIHVAPDPVEAVHIHHHTDDLTRFLGALV